MTNLSQDNLYNAVSTEVMWQETTSLWNEFIGKWSHYCIY